MWMYLVSTLLILDLAYAAPVIEAHDISSDGNAEELSDNFEGDIILTSAQEEAIEAAKVSRNGLRDGAKRWPNQTVVYYIDEDAFDDEDMEIINEAMAEIANKSCIKFRLRDKEERAVLIKGSAKGCFSNVGYINSDEDSKENQIINLAKGCFKLGTVVHEMLHTLGFYHMQSTHDRDSFVEIVWSNIKMGTEHNFAKYTASTVTDFGVPYDYASVMHYPEKAFSKNGNKTIIPLKEDVKIGQRIGMSEGDITKLKRMYCENAEEAPISYIA